MVSLPVTRAGAILAVGDVERSVAFYTGQLVLEMSGVQEAYSELSAAGLPFLAEPYSPPWGGHRCFVVDPDGYLIELEEPA